MLVAAEFRVPRLNICSWQRQTIIVNTSMSYLQQQWSCSSLQAMSLIAILVGDVECERGRAVQANFGLSTLVAPVLMPKKSGEGSNLVSTAPKPT